MSGPEKLDAIVERYQHYADEWRRQGRAKEADALEYVISLLKEGKINDPRVTPEGH